MNILVIVDPQNDFISGALGTPEAKEVVPKIVDKIKNYDTIIVTEDIHYDNYFETLEGRKLPVAHCLRNTLGAEIDESIELALRGKSVQFVEKNRFYTCELGYALLPYIDHKDSFKVEFVGFCTDICVISNALAIRNVFPNIEVCVDKNCCAGSSPEAHEAALMVMKNCLIEVN